MRIWVDADACPGVIKEILYSAENIRQLLDLRNFMDTLRSSGVETGGPPAFNHADRQSFADQLDRFIAKGGRPA